MKLTDTSLMGIMKKLGYAPKMHEETKQIHASYTYQENEYPIFVRLLSEGNLVQIITFIPCTITDQSLNDVSRFLHIVNKELDMPGFCCDEETKTIFYRIVIPAVDKEISEDLFNAYLVTSKNICQTFGTVIQALAIGAMSLDEVFEKMAEVAQEKTKK